MRHLFRSLPAQYSQYLLAAAFALSAMLWAPAALAEFHTYQIEEIFSNADGSVQYVVMHESEGMSAEYFWAGNPFISSGAGQINRFIFPNNLPVGVNCNPYYGCAKAMPTSTANTRVLIATQGFASLGVVTPDFVVPNGFLFTAGGTLNYAGVDQVTYGPLPTDGVTAINRSGMPIPNIATNFMGQSGSATPATTVNYQGLWYKAPAESEAGWGINFAHQGNTIFATWFTYDLTGKGWWLVMSATQSAPGVFSGALLQVTGPPFNSAPFPPIGSPGGGTSTAVGIGTVTFSDVNNGVFAYTVNGVTQSKAITRQQFGALPTCSFATQPNLALATNYQDLWWAAPAGSEAGWGINFAHEGNTIFASWFTYDLDRSPMWLVVTAPNTAPGVYSGQLFRTTGPPFNAVPFPPSGTPGGAVATAVGTATFTFTDGNNATFAYTVNGVSQAKAITRQVFQPPGTTCQ